MKLFRAVVRKHYSNGPRISRPHVTAKNITEALKKVEASLNKLLSNNSSDEVLSIREVDGYLL